MNSLGQLYTPAEQLYEKYRKNTLQLELTDHCNLHCPLCNQGMNSENVHGIEKGYITEVFWKLLDDIEHSKMKFFELQLFWFGEPLLHPQFKKYFQVLMLLMHQKQIFGQIDLHTNAELMDEEMSDMFLLAEAKLPCITLSLDAISTSVYDTVRCGGDFERVMNNIHYFIRRREELGQVLPTLRFQFLLHDKNAAEAREFQQYWKQFLEDNSRCSAFFREIIEYCETDSFRKRYVSDIDHPIYPHEIHKYNTYKKMQVHKDTIWFKRPNILPLARQAEFDAFYEEQIRLQNIRTEENFHSRTIAEVSNDFFAVHTDIVDTETERTDEIIPENMHINEAEHIDTSHHREDVCEFPDESVIEIPRRPPCISLFCKPVVRWDGTLTVCCNDPKGEMALGSIYENSFDELWFGEKINQYRKKHILGEFNDLPLCMNCRNFDGESLNNDEIIDFCEEHGLSELTQLCLKKK